MLLHNDTIIHALDKKIRGSFGWMSKDRLDFGALERSRIRSSAAVSFKWFKNSRAAFLKKIGRSREDIKKEMDLMESWDPQAIIDSWVTCRDVIYAIDKNLPYIYLSISPENAGEDISDIPKKIDSFFEIINKKLGIEIVEQAVFYTTTIDWVLKVEFGKWWRGSDVRRSLMTALLRSSFAFDGNNFDHALFSTNYTQSTREAVQRFLDGHTVYHGIFEGGWVNTFRQDTLPPNRLNQLRRL